MLMKESCDLSLERREEEDSREAPHKASSFCHIKKASDTQASRVSDKILSKSYGKLSAEKSSDYFEKALPEINKEAEESAFFCFWSSCYILKGC